MSAAAPVMTSPVQVVNPEIPSVATASMRHFHCWDDPDPSLERHCEPTLECAEYRTLRGDSLIDHDRLAFFLAREVRQVTAVEATHLRRSGTDSQ